MSAIRTSVTHPLRVDSVPGDVLHLPGRLGMTFAPGKRGSGIGCMWKRDLEADLEQLVAVEGASVLVSLIEDHELQTLGIPRLFDRARARGLLVERLPIPDGSAPADPEALLALVARLLVQLTDGKNVVVHCRGGLGRTGTLVAACLMVTGLSADGAIAATRRARPGAVENRQQEDFLRSLVVPPLRPSPRLAADATARFGWEAVAYTVNGYDLWGSFDRCAEIANRVNGAIHTGMPPKDFTTDELRTALFFTARANRHSGHEGDGVLENRIVSAIVDRMGAGWMRAELERAQGEHPTAGANEKTIGDLLDVRRARLVVIHDAWIGYNPHSPIAASYELRRGPRGGLAGEGHLSTAIAGERIVKVAIPSAAAARFLEGLAGARLTPGPYRRLEEHTDDYPHIEIALHVGAREIGETSGVALLFTRSQGEYNAPWGACIGGEIFTVPGEEVGRALAALRRPLKRATLERMAGSSP